MDSGAGVLSEFNWSRDDLSKEYWAFFISAGRCASLAWFSYKILGSVIIFYYFMGPFG